MANIASNTAFVYGYDLDKSKDIFDYLEKNLELTEEVEEEDVEDGFFIIYFDSKWSVPSETFLRLVQEFKVEIVGTTSEPGTCSVACWRFTGDGLKKKETEIDFIIHEL